MGLSARTPRSREISGFHKLVGMCFRICEDAFRDPPPPVLPDGTSADEERMITGTHAEVVRRTKEVGATTCESCAVLFGVYVSDTSLRLTQFSDELLCTCKNTRDAHV